MADCSRAKVSYFTYPNFVGDGYLAVSTIAHHSQELLHKHAYQIQTPQLSDNAERCALIHWVGPIQVSDRHEMDLLAET